MARNTTPTPPTTTRRGRANPHVLNLSKSSIRALVNPPKREDVRDERVPGLTLSITPAGARTFYVVRRIRGRPARVKIGAFPDVNPEHARRRAAEINAEIAAGRDPRAERDRIRGEHTLGEVWDRFVAEHGAGKLKPKTLHGYTLLWNQHCKAWRNRRLSEIRPEEISKKHAAIGKDTPYQANRWHSLIRRLFNYAQHTLRWCTENPAVGLERYREHSRDRFLRGDELARLFAALDAEPDVDWADFFRLAVFIGARRRNLLAMRWADLDLEAATWRIPDTKANEPQTVVLSPPAMDVLRRRSREIDGPWVFPSPATSERHLMYPQTAWARICERAKLEGVRMHDLRRTLGSWMAGTGGSLPIIGRALGHRHEGSTKVYARLDTDPIVAAVNRAAAAMLAATRPQDTEPAPDVVGRIGYDRDNADGQAG